MSKTPWWVVVGAIAVVALAAWGAKSFMGPGGSGGVGVIDLGAVIAQSPLAQRYEKQLADKYGSLQEQLEKEKTNLDEEGRKAKEKELMTEYLSLKQELEGKLEKEIDSALATIMKQKNLGVVVYKESVRHGGIDVTPEVVKALK
ncbi:MAG: OmpH family outer membrane protein [Firmicutes bacterium]|nr:OmpH family outer membrane protein [Bacillota bacterium]